MISKDYELRQELKDALIGINLFTRIENTKINRKVLSEITELNSSIKSVNNYVESKKNSKT